MCLRTPKGKTLGFEGWGTNPQRRLQWYSFGTSVVGNSRNEFTSSRFNTEVPISIATVCETEARSMIR